ncbi:MAG: HypC/HybG/HupF family hydrogenase formation chaperone [Bacteroidales bacterium]
MCLAIPGKILFIDESVPDLRMARVDFGGVIRNICVEWVEVELNDYILAHAGVALCRIDTEEAERSIRNFEQIINRLDALPVPEKSRVL